ncbi:MAG TPA: hypothetical protein VIS27_07910 [Yeosuana sp.]
MRTLKYLLSYSLALFVLFSCTDDENDLDYLTKAAAPSEVSALFQITPDNSGHVTIVPNAIGAVSYSVTLGDDAITEPVVVAQGESIEHIYAEGTYPVTIEATGLTGLKNEVTQQLVVSFRPPENLAITASIDDSNPFKVNVSATADFAASFEVYFDTSNPDEEPTPLMLDGTVSFIYPAVGDYTIKVVALSGGTETSELSEVVIISSPVELPIDFEVFDASKFIGFGGASASVVDNPDTNGNISAKVGQIIKGGPEPWAGDVIILSAPIDLSTKKIIKLDVWSPRPGGKLTFKLENLDDNTIALEKEVTLIGNSAWEEVLIDFSDIDVTKTYQKLVWFFDIGTVGTGGSDWTFYVDNIKQVAPSSGPTVFPLNFEAPFQLSSFDGGEISVIANPDTNGNPSSMVAKMVKGAGQVWAGSKITLDSPFVLGATESITVKVWSPRVGLKLLMKFEDAVPWPAVTGTAEITATTTVANAWEELTFVFPSIDTAIDWYNMVLIMDNGTVGDGSADFTIYVDDISTNPTLDFEPKYALSSFDGGEISVIANPDTNGNPSSMVAKMVKGAGQVWAGSKITVPIPFDLGSSVTITAKVWSPRVGLKLLMKFEDAVPWPAVSGTAEITATSTVANAWEELTFVFPTIDAAIEWYNMVLIMDNGTVGDGSADYTIYIDDISNN